jgi:hypothetical protein
MLNVFISNASEDLLSPKEAYGLYKIRWQVELIFKAWKSILNLGQIRKMVAERVRCYLYGKFIWVLLCRDLYASFEPLVWDVSKKLLSFYKCCDIVRVAAGELKMALFKDSLKLVEWLSHFYKGLYLKLTAMVETPAGESLWDFIFLILLYQKLFMVGTLEAT